MAQTIKLEIHRPDSPPKVFTVAPGTYSVGSAAECSIRLPHNDIAPQHAVLTLQETGVFWIQDLGSAGGTFANGQRVNGHMQLGPGQSVQLGPFQVIARMEGEAAAATPAAQQSAPSSQQATTPPTTTPPPAQQASTPKPPPPPKQPESKTKDANDPVLQQKRAIKQQIHDELVVRLDVKRMAASKIAKEELKEKALSTITAIVNDVATRLPPEIRPDELIKELYNESLGLGPLEDLLEDDTVTEIMVNGPDRIYVEQNGKLVNSGYTFMDDQSVLAIIERIVSPIGRRIDESQPYVDARLEDGSRVNAIIHPLSLIGPCLTIRKFSKTPLLDEDLIRFGTFTREAADFLQMCVQSRKNIIVSGGTGSGKTTLLNVLSNYLPDGERIVTIEDAAELRLTQDHVVRLESRPPNIEGRGAITIRDLVRNSLRMRPDRIVVGECRGGEALDMLQAMNTGHDGSLTTVHANTPRDVISRLETMVLMSGMELPVRAIREQVAAAVDLVVHESRLSDGSRKVVKITEVLGLEGDRITMQDIFEFVQTSVDEDGKVIGQFRPTGSVPTFIEEFKSRGMDIDHSIFDPQKYK